MKTPPFTQNKHTHAYKYYIYIYYILLYNIYKKNTTQILNSASQRTSDFCTESQRSLVRVKAPFADRIYEGYGNSTPTLLTATPDV